MAETASCAGRGAGLASSACRSSRSSAPRQPAPRPVTSSPRGSHALRPVEPPCGQEPFDDLAVVFPSRRLGVHRRDRARQSPRARLRCARLGDRLADRGRARGPRSPTGGRRSCRRWSAYRDHGPRLVGDGGCDVRLGRGGGRHGGAGGAARVAAAHGPRARPSTRAGCSRTRPPMRSRCSCGRRRSGPSTRRSQAERLFPRGRRFEPDRFAAIERHALRADTRRAPGPAPPRRRPDRGAAAGGRRSRSRARPSPSGCALVAADDGRGRAVVARQLARTPRAPSSRTCARESGRLTARQLLLL